MPQQPVRPSLNTWGEDLYLWHTHAAAVAQLVTQEHLNHLYHPFTGQCETYDKINL